MELKGSKTEQNSNLSVPSPTAIYMVYGKTAWKFKGDRLPFSISFSIFLEGERDKVGPRKIEDF